MTDTNVKAHALNSDITKLAADAVAGGAKGLDLLVSRTLVGYSTMSKIMHQTACAALFFGFETGDSRPLTKLFSGLRQNDADALRIWVGKLATVTHSQDDGSEVETAVVTFKKDAGFAFKKGVENLRKGYLSLESLIAGPSFMDVNQKESAEYDLKKLLAMLLRVEKQADKKASEHEFEIPAELMGAIKSLTSTANKVGATLN